MTGQVGWSPCHRTTEPASRTSQPWVRWEWVNSQTRRDFPTPGSPTRATTLAVTRAGARQGPAEQLDLGVAADEPASAPRAAAAWKSEPRHPLAPVSS